MGLSCLQLFHYWDHLDKCINVVKEMAELQLHTITLESVIKYVYNFNYPNSGYHMVLVARKPVFRGSDK